MPETVVQALPDDKSAHHLAEALFLPEDDQRFQVRQVSVHGLDEAFHHVGFDPSYVAASQRKFRHQCYWANDLSAPAANILKQTCLTLGAEAAVHKHAIDCKVDRAPVLLSATQTQLDRILKKLRPQPFALPKMAAAMTRMQQRQKHLAGRQSPQLVGILNMTPDSFSDGGRYDSIDTVLETVAAWQAAGVNWVDVGGESTRPGAVPVPLEDEITRVQPVIKALAEAFPDLHISIDTRKAAVAAMALDTGATRINDVSGLCFDPDMLRVVAEADCPVVIMHAQGTPETMQDDPQYPDDDVVGTVSSFFYQQVARAVEAGVAIENIWLDPGFGFGKTTAHNMTLLKRLDELVSIGFPLFVGFSRKRFLTSAHGEDTPLARENQGLVSLTMAFQAGAKAFRVHDPLMFAPALHWLNEVNGMEDVVRGES